MPQEPLLPEGHGIIGDPVIDSQSEAAGRSHLAGPRTKGPAAEFIERCHSTDAFCKSFPDPIDRLG